MSSAVLHFHSVSPGELPPPAPRDCFGRDELIEKVVGLAENLEPIALIGAGGIGKTFIALTVLHHNRIEERFGENRRFIRCDQFPASRSHFLARLSKVIGAGVENPEDLTPLRPLLSSKEMLIILDNAESILDPKETGAREVYSVIEELCQFKKLCICITSRITTVPPRCELPEIPTLSMEAACDIFYRIYRNVGRSSVIDDLLKSLDFHALSIKLLATTASHNRWDHDRMSKEWNAQRAQVLKTDYNESLAATIELSLSSPTFLSLGPDARDLLGVIAFFPQGVDENNLDWLFPTIPNRKNIFDKFCVLSLTYRSNGFTTMLAPIRDYVGPQNPQSFPLLCRTRDHYFSRLSAVGRRTNKPPIEESRWIVLEDVNVEHLLDVFTSLDPIGRNTWDICRHFVEHLVWHKQRQTILGPKIEALADTHPSKPVCLIWLSWLFQQLGNHAEQKRLLIHTLELERQRGNDAQVARMLQSLSNANRLLGLCGEGIRQAKEGLKIYERINDTVGQAQSLGDLASLLRSDKQFDAAENAASRAIDLAPKEGQGYLLCTLHRVLGEIHQAKGVNEKAIYNFKAALELASPSKWRDELFSSHFGLANLFHDERKLDEANSQIERAKSHAAYNAYWLGRAMELQAMIWSRQGRLEDAKSEASRALKLFEERGVAEDVDRCRNLFQKIERAKNGRRIRS